MRRTTRLGGFTVLAFAIALAGCSEPPTPTEVKVSGGPVTVIDIAGFESALRELKGKPVLIDFWATWCPPCRERFPEFVQTVNKYEPKGLAGVSVSLDNTSDLGNVEEFLRKNQATFTNVLLKRSKSSGDVLQSRFHYQNAIPHTVLLDKNGKHVWDSSTSEESSESYLESLIQKELAK